jgi:hypothetical protein
VLGFPISVLRPAAVIAHYHLSNPDYILMFLGVEYIAIHHVDLRMASSTLKQQANPVAVAANPCHHASGHSV